MSKVIALPERKFWLDALRGVAMILVIYGHCVPGWTNFFVFTSPVRMPLFFAISGYLFNPRGGCLLGFFRSILLKLVIPWLVLGLFPYTHPIDRLLNLLSGKVLWFMPCLIIAEILWFFVHKYSKSTLQVFCLGILLSATGFALAYFNALNYARINTAFIAQGFFVIGCLIRLNENRLERRWRLWVSAAVIIYLLLCFITLFLFPGLSIDVHLNRYYNLPICIILIAIGLTTLFTLFRVKSFAPTWLVYIGQNTLIIYIMHGFVLIAMNKCLSVIGLATMSIPIKALINTSIACIVCCCLAFFANKYVPEIVGKKRSVK